MFGFKFFTLEQNVLNKTCGKQILSIEYKKAFLDFSAKIWVIAQFTSKILKAKRSKKADLAFAYEAQKVFPIKICLLGGQILMFFQSHEGETLKSKLDGFKLSTIASFERNPLDGLRQLTTVICEFL